LVIRFHKRQDSFPVVETIKCKRGINTLLDFNNPTVSRFSLTFVYFVLYTFYCTVYLS